MSTCPCTYVRGRRKKRNLILGSWLIQLQGLAALQFSGCISNLEIQGNVDDIVFYENFPLTHTLGHFPMVSCEVSINIYLV